MLIDSQVAGAIDNGVVVLLGIHPDDTLREVRWMAEKIIHLRIFEDDEGKMNRSLIDVGGEMLIVSQFTLYGDCQGVTTATGTFQASMQVQLVNDGPVTLLLDSEKNF